MGQMHVQRALELPEGPKLIIATEISDERLQTLIDMFSPLAEKQSRTLLTLNPNTAKQSFHDFVMHASDGQGADDVVVSVPIASLMEEADTVMKPRRNAGILRWRSQRNDGNGQPQQCLSVQRAIYRHIRPDDQRSGSSHGAAHGGHALAGRSVAAIGGWRPQAQAIQSVMDSRYPGKVVIFPANSQPAIDKSQGIARTFA